MGLGTIFWVRGTKSTSNRWGGFRSPPPPPIKSPDPPHLIGLKATSTYCPVSRLISVSGAQSEAARELQKVGKVTSPSPQTHHFATNTHQNKCRLLVEEEETLLAALKTDLNKPTQVFCFHHHKMLRLIIHSYYVNSIVVVITDYSNCLNGYTLGCTRNTTFSHKKSVQPTKH